MFPVYAGGSGNETVKCTLYYEDLNLILVAGKSNSADFAPAVNDHAYAYALDFDGNWMWGKFFYNVSMAVSEITGCDKGWNGNAVMLCQMNQVPVILEISPQNGTVHNFMFLD